MTSVYMDARHWVDCIAGLERVLEDAICRHFQYKQEDCQCQPV